MAWIEPKTDWVKDDFFNYWDYNRIIGNLVILNEMAQELFAGIRFEEMGADKEENDLIFAREFNLIEDNLYNIAKWTYGENTRRRIYKDNGAVPSYMDYNRLESMILLLYEKMTVHKDSLHRLPFRLGNQKGMRA